MIPLPIAVVTHIGRTARDLLSRNRTAVVMGVSSKGVFISLATKEVVFVSSEPYRGPLTLNLSSGFPGECRIGEGVVIQKSRLDFDWSGISLDLRDPVPWEAPDPPGNLLPVEQCLNNLRLTAGQVLSVRRGAGLSRLLVDLLNLPESGELELPTQFDSQAAEDLAQLGQILRSGNAEAALIAAESFLGLGSGLTPSGDDLLLGLLLALNRWGMHLGYRFETQAFNRVLIEEAQRKTTTLSANLLACAANGQADERLVAALDGMLTGQLPASACAERLLGWGSSSGCDALVGMALAILAFMIFWP